MGNCSSSPAVEAVVASKAARSSQEKTERKPISGIGSNTLYKPVLDGHTEDVKDLYVFDKVLGKGQFGITRLVRERTSGEQYACKTISKRKLVNPEDIEDVQREIKVMHHLSGHPNVVTFKGAYEDNQSVHIVMELCTGGELFQHIAAKGHYREKDAAALMRTLVQVVAHCHSMNVVHRDLKPENFLFKESTKKTLKAIDFGLSNFYQDGKNLKDLVGSPFYMAPEVLKRSYGKAADIWSCGVIMYILLCGWPPFYGTTTQQIFRAVLNDPLDLVSPPWGSLSKQAKDCVKRMLVRDPAQRATAAEILNHEWMKEHTESDAESTELQPEILKRMRKFAGMNRLKKEALRVIAAHLPTEEIEGVRQMFQDMDTDASGTISFEELRNGVRRKGGAVADEELQRIMAEMDMDGNQMLDFEEFLTATVFLGRLQKHEELLSAFSHFDQDGSGFLTEDELLSALRKQKLPESDIQEVLAEVDRDKDGRIDYDEFARMMLADGPDRKHQAGGRNHSRGNLADAAAASGTGSSSGGSVMHHTVLNAKSGGTLGTRQKALQEAGPLPPTPRGP